MSVRFSPANCHFRLIDGDRMDHALDRTMLIGLLLSWSSAQLDNGLNSEAAAATGPETSATRAKDLPAPGSRRAGEIVGAVIGVYAVPFYCSLE